ncbi:MAG TPA: TadE/TadG family type IV pilus assembly protein [Nitrospirota bacterium]|nr:TadE/TadG family type IV pilus assembly protein [Nitrospirota bacterium]
MSTGNREKGASAVEFALILPVLILILFGIIEFGFIIYDKAVITNASREGARAGIVYKWAGGAPSAVSPGTITSIVESYCATMLISLGGGPAVPSTTVTGNCAVAGSALTVAVSYPYSFLVLPNFVQGLSGAITLNATTVMNCENQL